MIGCNNVPSLKLQKEILVSDESDSLESGSSFILTHEGSPFERGFSRFFPHLDTREYEEEIVREINLLSTKEGYLFHSLHHIPYCLRKRVMKDKTSYVSLNLCPSFNKGRYYMLGYIII